MDYADLGKRIRVYREKAKMTQEMLGEEIDYSIQHISHIETGKTKMSVECLFDIANALNISLDELVCGYVNAASGVLDQELQELLEDCSSKEKLIILDVVKALKESLKASWEQ